MSSRSVLRYVLSPVAGLLIAAATIAGQQPHFYSDDPIVVDDDMSLDASNVRPVEDSNGYDFVINTFSSPGVKHNVRAGNVNTIDEVPDSSWFTNRMGVRRLTTDELVRGPDRLASISLQGWKVSGGKSTGVQPGFRMTDPTGQMYQIEFDPPSNPEMATAAEVIGTAFYHAFGYHTVEVYLAELDPASLEIAPDARISDALIGERRSLTRRDVDDVLRRVARLPNGRYRVLASRFAEGKPLGNFRYYATRTDDPNDLVPHEDRRELRAARVFGAWLNHDDSRGVNSLDFLHTDGARRYVKHYMFDFGSIMGSGTVFPQRHRAGNEYIFEPRPGWLTLATLGIHTRPWLHIKYPDDLLPSVGRFESAAFDPEAWRPEYPNPAFDNMRADDAFWAARVVARFTDADIRAIVEKARYSDPRATEYITATLIERRNRVVGRWLSGVIPLVNFVMRPDGTLSFENVAVSAGLASAPDTYDARWMRFDNTSGPVGDAVETTIASGEAAPPAILAGTEFVQVELSARQAQFPSWQEPVTVHFRRTGSGWNLVGVRRLP